MEALVTGGAGFLGSHLCDFLLARGWRVTCVDNLETGSARNVAHLEGRDDFRFVTHDVARPLVDHGEPVKAELRRPFDVVYHLASPASPQHYYAKPLETMRAALWGTFHALELAQVKGARFLFASSSEIYGDPLVQPQPESYWGNCNPAGPRSVYAEGKRYGEAMTTVYRGLGVDTAIIRPFNVYGPRMNPNDGRVVPSFLRQALAGEPIVVYGDGSQTRSLCYVDDAVRGIVAVAESLEHDPVNIGNPDEISMLELAETVVEVTGSISEIVFAELPQDDPRRRVPDISRARALLGWEPEIPLADGLAWTAEAFRGR